MKSIILVKDKKNSKPGWITPDLLFLIYYIFFIVL